jgi:hypothetical protein
MIPTVSLTHFCVLFGISLTSFQIQYKSAGNVKNDWNTQGIKISCKYKRSLSPVGIVITQTQEHFH